MDTTQWGCSVLCTRTIQCRWRYRTQYLTIELAYFPIHLCNPITPLGRIQSVQGSLPRTVMKIHNGLSTSRNSCSTLTCAQGVATAEHCITALYIIETLRLAPHYWTITETVLMTLCAPPQAVAAATHCHSGNETLCLLTAHSSSRLRAAVS